MGLGRPLEGREHRRGAGLGLVPPVHDRDVGSATLLEFSPDFSGGEITDRSGELVCNTGETVVTCHIEDAQGIDSVEVQSGGQTLVTADTPPFEFELQRSNIDGNPHRNGVQSDLLRRRRGRTRSTDPFCLTGRSLPGLAPGDKRLPPRTRRTRTWD